MQNYLEKYVGRVYCNNDVGTAFLVSNKELLTAHHTVENIEENATSIFVELDEISSEPLEVILKDFDESLDIAILELIQPLDIEYFLKLSNQVIRSNSTWSTFGFPRGKLNAGAKLDGTVARSNVNIERSNYELDLEYNQSNEFIEGLSGAPLIVSDTAIGIITKELDGTLGAISICKIATLLDKNDITYESLEESSKYENGFELNTPVVDELTDKITSLDSGYLFLKGHPGSGKTTLVESVDYAQSDIAVLGKYFLLEKGKENLLSLRMSHLNFLEWLEDLIVADLYNAVPQKSERDINQWITTILDLLQKLSDKYATKQTKCVIFVDGIDELFKSKKIEEFFSALPVDLPKNIIFVIVGQNENTLPPKHIIQGGKNIIFVTPLPENTCLRLINKELPELSYELSNKIGKCSEYHPLYLRYLVEYVKANMQVGKEQEINDWLDQLPQVSGEIEVYYESLWKDIVKKDELLYLVSLISRFRESISYQSLLDTVPSSMRVSVDKNLDLISHFLTSKQDIFAYHSSLISFVSKKTEALEEDFQSQISLFCKKNIDISYSQRNIVHHLLRATADVRNETIDFCNQKWADNCSQNFVEPDLILADLKDVLSFYLQKGCFISVIKLLLLSQRIKFRYNNVFALNAMELAEYLIAMKKPKEALHHIFREYMPLVSLKDLIYLQYKLIIENNAEEAEFIHSAIHSYFMSEYEKGSIASTDLVDFFTSASLNNCLLSNTPMKSSSKVIEFLYKFLISSKDQSEEQQEQNRKIFFYILGHNTALLLLHHNIYLTIEELEKREIPVDNSITMALIQAYSHVGYFSDISGEQVDLDNIVQDIEYGLIKYKPDEEDSATVLRLLDGISIKYELLEGLISKCNSNDIPIFRESNGVDLNHNWFLSLLSNFKYKGFLDELYCPPDLKFFSETEWEKSLESIVSYIGYLLGFAWKLKVISQESEQLSVDMLEKVLPLLKFDLLTRSQFERSYMLVEEVLPFIYNSILEFFSLYSKENLNKYLNFIYEHSDKQLGVYSEGFRETIHTIAKSLLLRQEYKKQLFHLLKKLEGHVLLGVQNRWDRCRELLLLATHYRALGSSRADGCFQELLNSSMGPSWYKEDQLGLINSSLSMLKRHNASWSPKELAPILDFSAGEMTFQRYIRMEKEEFIGSLCSSGKLSTAIKYFQDETIPLKPNLILHRAESNQIDSLYKGASYDTGVRKIDEQSGILNILENTKGIQPSLQWAICELFLIGDVRYINRFSEIFAKTINNSNTIHSNFYMNRIIRILNTDMEFTIRNQFISGLNEHLEQRYFDELIVQINKNKIDVEFPTIPESTTTEIEHEDATLVDRGEDDIGNSIYLPGTFGTSQGLKEFDIHFTLAKEASDIEDEKTSKQELLLSLRAIQDSGWGVWSRNLGQNDQAFSELSKLCDENELLEILTPLIIDEPHATDWLIVDKLISKFSNVLSHEKVKKLHECIIEHIKIMVSPPNHVVEGFEWMDLEDSKTISNDQELMIFLLNFIDHPSPSIYSRVPSIIKSISRFDPDIYLPILAEHSLTGNQALSPEIAVGIIYSLVIEDVSLIKSHLNIQSLFSKIENCKHLVIKHTWSLIVARINNLDSSLLDEDVSLDNAIFNSKPVDINGKVEIGIDINDLGDSLGYILSRLTKIGVWKDSDLLSLNKLLIQSNPCLGFDEIFSINDKIQKGYNLGENKKFINDQLMPVINQIVQDRVTEENINSVVSALRQFNPNFPDESVQSNSQSSLNEKIIEFLSRSSQNPMDFLKEGDNEYLHYFEVIVPHDKSPKMIEISIFLIKSKVYLEPSEFQANQHPMIKDIHDLKKRKSECFLFNCAPGINYAGGRVSPSLINLGVQGFAGKVKHSDISENHWIEGRSWDSEQLGRPIREGNRLMMTSEKLDLLSQNGWEIFWRVDYNFTSQFVINRKTLEVSMIN
ncbi:serine protease [Pseudoalteromonas sp. SMS1]|uniref:serine protease n=1 Tax=Pseudoalteromonas sp. SMS1 TaxID=2908894 RepID=UPI001F174A13|nr:serine protease [Pseudoalteromonas sp. SMS1]MCF2858591.1 serine protease [Pseudoalteromonas sp. SMS1]